MKTINVGVSVLLAVATGGWAALFWLGTEGQHQLLVKNALWTTFAERFLGMAAVGLVGSIIWWVANAALRKFSIAKDIDLSQTALLLAAGPLIGALLGTFVFCFA